MMFCCVVVVRAVVCVLLARGSGGGHTRSLSDSPLSNLQKKKYKGMHDVCRRYRALMTDWHAAPYAVKAAAFWAIEAVYNNMSLSL